ncbi:hypothetical protein UFOVP380_42 [uncultured Caudovirales phage]|uniref:Uncharacterized protein n=1 Tax=uncultured Caudovirales phage TaxID=2100421 RepID=A0A6J7WZC8_9CAUD|nr:hypothetical protein UFOVP380_42 [uncultured Caudovirales phage]
MPKYNYLLSAPVEITSRGEALAVPMVSLGFWRFYTKRLEIAKKHIKPLEALIASSPTLGELKAFGVDVAPVIKHHTPEGYIVLFAAKIPEVYDDVRILYTTA